MSAANEVFAFQVRIKGIEGGETVINARSAGKAKRQKFLDVLDVLPDLKFTDLRARKLGPPESSESFIRTALYRGLRDLRCGDRVSVGSSAGVVVGHNSSSNFVVLFDDNDPRYPGRALGVHPSEIKTQNEQHQVAGNDQES